MATLRTRDEGRWLRLPGRAAREIVAGSSGARALHMLNDATEPTGPGSQ